MKNRKSYTLTEMVIVILIIAILAAAAVPIMRGRINSAKWSEGKTMAGTLAVAIRTYIAGTAKTGIWDEDTLAYSRLGFNEIDFDGTYFNRNNFSWDVEYDGIDLDYTITVTRPPGLDGSTEKVLNSSGKWDENDF